MPSLELAGSRRSDWSETLSRLLRRMTLWPTKCLSVPSSMHPRIHLAMNFLATQPRSRAARATLPEVHSPGLRFGNLFRPWRILLTCLSQALDPLRQNGLCRTTCLWRHLFLGFPFPLPFFPAKYAESSVSGHFCDPDSATENPFPCLSFLHDVWKL